jgi:two-component system, OmpR family, aerobic respiration control sensor histidine kinase ArcB
MKNHPILLVEDNAIASKAARILLQDLGCCVQTADNAETGISLFKSQYFDLVIADLGLPGIQGDEMTNLLRYWEKIFQKNPTPIVALTAHADDQIKNNCLLAGMNQVYMKPLDKPLLENILKWARKSSPTSDGIKEEKKVFEGLGRDLPNTESELFQLEKYPIFDEQEGIKQSGGKEMLREALSMSIEDIIPTEITNIEAAYLIQDWENVQKIAHKLKGGSLYCGTIRMTYACQYLERYWKAGHRKLLEELYQQFMTVTEQTEQAISRWLKN